MLHVKMLILSVLLAAASSCTLIVLDAKHCSQEPSGPQVVATPPADAGRGLIRISEQELRHYSGRGSSEFLRSLDNGRNWESVPVPPSFPPQVAGLAKEACNLVPLPGGEWLRFPPTGGYVWRSEGGIDGSWTRLLDPTSSGDEAFLSLAGNKRGGLWVNDGRRLLIPSSQGRSWVWFSDDDGHSFKRSSFVHAPPHEMDFDDGGVHRGRRWNHDACEPTLVELRDGRLWMIVRTAQDQHWECFSSDFGSTWSAPRPSRFWATCTMPTITRLADGRLLMLWSNTTPLPESRRTDSAFREARGERVPGGEDVFTNRDTQHAALSDDDGRSWRGFRELILDEMRNNADYAVTPGSNDRGKHQSQVVQLDDRRVLISLGQHPLHRRLLILDLDWLLEDERHSDLGEAAGLEDWMYHAYIPQIRGHCGYNREPGGRHDPVLGGLVLGRPHAPQRTAPEFEIDYTREGATWNFPGATGGRLSLRLRLRPGGQGLVISLHDRWFNPVDVTAERFAAFRITIPGDGRLGDAAVMPVDRWCQLSLVWDGLDEAAEARVLLNGQDTGRRLPLHQAPRNPLSYVHVISAAESIDDAGFVIGAAHMQATH
jgi:BNR repeat protein